MQKYTERVKTISQKLQFFRQQLTLKLTQNKLEPLNYYKPLRDDLYNLINSKPTIEERVHVNQLIRKNFKDFIKFYMEPKIYHLKHRSDPQFFVQTMSEIWANYERFVFSHDFIIDKLKQFYETFHKMKNAKSYEKQGEIVSLPTMAVQELKKQFQRQNLNLFQMFPKHFCNFLVKEREGISVPRQMLKQTMSAIQSCFFDFQAMISLDVNRKPHIHKNPRAAQEIARRSKDSKYVEENIIKNVLKDCEQFYKNLVNERCSKMNPSQQLQLMTKIINEEESRSIFYIHSHQNQQKYMTTVSKTLIGLNIDSRLTKEQGLIKYLRQYQINNQEYKSELVKFWKIYSRVINLSLPLILQIYSSYLDEQALVAEQKAQKFFDFIPQIVRINTKNIQIIQCFGYNFQLQNLRNDKIKKIFSNQVIKNSKSYGKHTMGASHLALFVNVKFKQIYAKGWQGNKQTFDNLVLIFKLLQQKVHFTKQHEKLTASRLLQDVDFSKDNQYSLIINLEKKFIDEMQKQMGISEVKELLQYVKDIEKSSDHTKRIKQKLGSNIHSMNQIIIKHNTFWPQKSSYQISPPSVLLRTATEVQNYFKTTSNIQFQYNNGVSLFRGEFKSKVPKQNFLLKNIYMIILLILDQAPNKKMLYGDIKSRIKSYGTKKDKGNLQLAKNIIELLHIGLLLSSTKILSKQDPNCVKISQSDQFELNQEFDYEEQMKKNKVPPKMIKKVPVIKTVNLMTPEWIKKMFLQGSNEIAEDEKLQQAYRRIRVCQLAVKYLKHAHNSDKNVTLQELFNSYSSPQNRQYKVTEKYLKQIIEELINKEMCQRVDGQRNVFKYKA